ncbi:MAG: hypothetical protein FWH20_08945 [Oscillospiraceae bacterium]|nr:hypothetical protein [Oscillospiraceae bacterium]
MLKDLYVMKVDAKQELDNINSQEGLELYKKSILIPNGINIDSIYDGDVYFLVGEKGAGKTALLIYVALKAEEMFEAERSFIIFKEFSQEEREDYTKMSHITHYEQEDILPYYDYEYVWRWIIHNNIAETIETSMKEIFIPNDDLSLYLAAVKAIEKNPRGDKRYFPVISKDGYVKASTNVPIGGASINLEGRINFEREPSQSNKIRFSTHINELDRLFVNLSAGNSQLYVVIDEMNLSTKNHEEYDRDIQLIRDSIIIIDKFNALCKNSHDNVRIIGSVRNEVINSVKSRGKEVNKIIESYSIPIDWTIYREEKITHPLIKVLINYIRLSDVSGNNYNRYNDEELYKRLITESFYKDTPSVSTILDYTLYRPRHVVRLLSALKRLCPNAKKITREVFDSIKRDYGRECWNEVTEDLSLKYSSDELYKIQEWLTGMPYFTTYSDMLKKAESLWEASDKELLERFPDIIRDIYKAGIIGNITKENIGYGTIHMKHRWSFRGDDILLQKQHIQIHRIFQQILSTTRPEKHFFELINPI